MAPSNTTIAGGHTGSDRSATAQGGYQMLALVITLAIAIVGGVITGTYKYRYNFGSLHVLLKCYCVDTPFKDFCNLPLSKELTFIDTVYRIVNG